MQYCKFKNRAMHRSDILRWGYTTSYSSQANLRSSKLPSFEATGMRKEASGANVQHRRYRSCRIARRAGSSFFRCAQSTPIDFARCTMRHKTGKIVYIENETRPSGRRKRTSLVLSITVDDRRLQQEIGSSCQEIIPGTRLLPTSKPGQPKMAKSVQPHGGGNTGQECCFAKGFTDRIAFMIWHR